MQQIDFCKSLPKSTNRLPALWMAIALVLLIIILITVSFSLASFQIYQGQHLKTLEEERIAVMAEFQKVVKNYPLFASDKPLVTRVSEYEKLVLEKQAKFAQMSHTTLRKPFSMYLQTLSQTTPEGVWLTYFRIDQDQNDLAIAGFSLQPILVSQFLQAMQGSSGMGDIVFDLFFVRKIPNQDYIRFEVANEKLRTLHEKTKTKNEPTKAKET